MAHFRIVAIYIIVFISVQVAAFGGPKTGSRLQSGEDDRNTTNAIEMKKGSRLRMYKTSSGVVLNNKGNETLRRARDLVVGTPLVNFRDISKYGQSEFSQDFIYETNGAPYAINEPPSQLPDKHGPNVYPSKAEDNTAERYYYNDFGAFVKDTPPKTEQIWNVNDISEPKYPRIPPSQHAHRRPPPIAEKNACRQYLEFLRYAFEQLDNTARKHQNDHRDDYYYYDDDYSEGEYRMFNTKTYGTKPPPLLIPDIAKLRSLTYNDNYGTENTYSYVRNGFINESESAASKTPETNRRTPQSTLAPVTSEITHPDTKSFSSSSTNATSSRSVENISPSTVLYEIRSVPVINTSATTEDDRKLVYRVGIANTTVRAEEVGGGRHDGCQDRLFPCPDNINVTYPVNGYCNRFVVCESGKPNPEFCQEGLHFNLITLQCDLPHNSFCTYSCPRENGYFGVPGVCGGFFRCQDWYPEFRMCPPRMHWDLKAKICTFQELSSCPLKCEEPYEVRPYNGDCSSYIICTRGKPTYHRCPDGMNFDRNLLKCMSKSLSNCTDDEDYIARNGGIENGRKKLCAKIELKEGKSKWCQEVAEDK